MYVPKFLEEYSTYRIKTNAIGKPLSGALCCPTNKVTACGATIGIGSEVTIFLLYQNGLPEYLSQSRQFYYFVPML